MTIAFIGIHLAGLRSAQPAASTVPGRYYKVTDEGNIVEFSDGATWTQYGPDAPGAGTGTTIVLKTANETVTASTTLQNDNELLFAVGANETWLFEFVLFASNTAATGDIKISITGPTAAAGSWGVLGASSEVALGVNTFVGFRKTVWDGSDFIGLGVRAGTPGIILVKGIIVNGANAGNLQLQWAQGVSDGTGTIVEARSHLIVTPVI